MPGPASATSKLTVDAPTATVLVPPSFLGRINKFLFAVWFLLAVGGIAWSVGSKNQRGWCWKLCACLILLLLLQTACGGGNGAMPGMTNQTVTVTATSRAVQHAIQINVAIR